MFTGLQKRLQDHKDDYKTIFQLCQNQSQSQIRTTKLLLGPLHLRARGQKRKYHSLKIRISFKQDLLLRKNIRFM